MGKYVNVHHIDYDLDGSNKARDDEFITNDISDLIIWGYDIPAGQDDKVNLLSSCLLHACKAKRFRQALVKHKKALSRHDIDAGNLTPYIRKNQLDRSFKCFCKHVDKTVSKNILSCSAANKNCGQWGFPLYKKRS